MKSWRLEEILALLPDPTHELVARLVEQANEMSVCLYLVGGPVRDLLLGQPLVDVDLLVAGEGRVDTEALAEKAAGGEYSLRRHRRFGTVTLFSAEIQVDLATLRRETYAQPAALPKVEPGTLEEDLRRRDFTVNCLALQLCGETTQKSIPVIDLEDGQRDLEERVLRVLHRRSFHDDPTRALRAARLAPRLGFHLSRGSRSVLRDALRDGVFGAVSGDRLRREFEKLFADAGRGVDPGVGLALLEKWHVLPALEPGLGIERSAVTPLRRLGRLLADPQWSSREIRPWIAGVCVWLAPLSPSLRRRTVKRLSIRGEIEQRIVDFPRVRDRRLKALEKTRGRGAVDRVLHDIDEESLYALFAYCSPASKRRVLRWATEDRKRRMPVGGKDLLAAGLSGPVVGKALARIRAAVLDDEVVNREEALALARELERGERRPAPRRKIARRRS